MNSATHLQTPAARRAEADLFRAYWDDGLLDLLAGLALATMGAGWAAGLELLAVIQPPLWIVLWIPLRRRIVEPRAGFVRFSLARRERNAGALRGTLVLGAGLLALTAAAVVYLREHGGGPALAGFSPGIPAILIAVASLVAGGLTGARRFQLYAAVLLAASTATVMLDGGPALPLLAVGLLVAGTGAALLRRFLQASREHSGVSHGE